jgi:GPH family glycoside/pentoside/hexuronide:cation symporter
VPSEHRILRRLAGEMTEVFRNPSFRYLFVGVLVFFVGQGVWQTLGLHTGRYFWNFDTRAIQMIGISTVGGLALGLPIAFLVIGRIEKRTMVLSGIFAVCLAEMLPILAQIFGVFPQPVHFPVLIAAAILSGMLATLVAIAFQSSMADAADEHEARFGTRREGVYFAGLSFAGKAATGLGSLISGFLLDLIAFPSAQIASGKHVVVTPDVVRDLGLASGPAAVGITLIAMVILSRYRLDRAAHTEIRRQLAKGNAL